MRHTLKPPLSSPISLEGLPRELGPAMKIALDQGAKFESRKMEVPFPVLAHPGMFAILKCLAQPLACPTCCSSEVRLNGVPRRKKNRVQQIECVAGSHKKNRFFNEYTGTPLEELSVGISQWLAIRHWWIDHPRYPRQSRPREQRPTLEELAKRVGLSRATVGRIIRSERKNPQNPHSRYRNPARLFTTDKSWQKDVYVKARESTLGTTDIMELALVLLPNDGMYFNFKFDFATTASHESGEQRLA